MTNSEQNQRQPEVPHELINRWAEQDREATTNTAGGKPDLHKIIGDAFDAGMKRHRYMEDHSWGLFGNDVPDKETYLSSLHPHPAQPQEGGKDEAVKLLIELNAAIDLFWNNYNGGKISSSIEGKIIAVQKNCQRYLSAPKPDNETGFVSLVLAERMRQVEKEGWTADHDAEHKNGELAIAAACYAAEGTDAQVVYQNLDSAWPWDEGFWKPTTKLRNLVKATALLLAEGDRVLSKELPHPGKPDATVSKDEYKLMEADRDFLKAVVAQLKQKLSTLHEASHPAQPEPQERKLITRKELDADFERRFDYTFASGAWADFRGHRPMQAEFILNFCFSYAKAQPGKPEPEGGTDAIQFSEWVGKNLYAYSGEGTWHGVNIGDSKTSGELYQKFKEVTGSTSACSPSGQPDKPGIYFHGIDHTLNYGQPEGQGDTDRIIKSLEELTERQWKKIEKLEKWKEDAIAVDFPRQEIAKALSIGLGESIEDKVLPKILELKQRIKELERSKSNQ